MAGESTPKVQLTIRPMPWEDRCFLARPIELADEVDYLRDTLRLGYPPFQEWASDSARNDKATIDAAMHGLYLAHEFERCKAVGWMDMAILNAVGVGECTGVVRGLKTRKLAEIGNAVRVGASKRRRRDPVHDHAAIADAYLRVRPSCNSEAMAYDRVRAQIDTRPSDNTIRKAIREENAT